MKKIILIKKLGTFTLMFMLFGTFAKATVHNLTITATDTVIYHFLQKHKSHKKEVAGSM